MRDLTTPGYFGHQRVMGKQLPRRLVVVIDLPTSEHPELRERIRDTVADYRSREPGKGIPAVRFFEESEAEED